jgi:hypothetical protein
MIIKYTTKKGKKKEIEIDPVYRSIDVITDDGNFAQVHLRKFTGRGEVHSTIGNYFSRITCFFDKTTKLSRKVYRR